MTPPRSNFFSDLAEATDRLFDRELSRAEREALSADLATDPEALRRFRETTDALLELRRPIETPDVSAAVLARLDVRPGFSTRRGRRLITTTRLAVAAALLGAGAGVLILQKYPQPDARTVARSSDRPRDALAERLHDPLLAAEELATLDLSEFSPASRVSAGLPPSLSMPRLDFDLSALEIQGGAAAPELPAWVGGMDRPLVLEFPVAGDLMLDPEALDEAWPLGAPMAPFRDIRLDPPSTSLLVPGLEFVIPQEHGSGSSGSGK